MDENSLVVFKKDRVVDQVVFHFRQKIPPEIPVWDQSCQNTNVCAHIVNVSANIS